MLEDFAAGAGARLEIVRRRGLDGAVPVYHEALTGTSPAAADVVEMTPGRAWLTTTIPSVSDYMSTREEDPGAANAAGTGSGEDVGGDAAAERDAAERGAGAAAKVRAWCTGRLPADWFSASPDIQVDREEITIVGTLDDPAAAGDSDAERAAAAEDRIRRFREETRSRRIEIAREAEHRFRRKVSWGVTCGPVTRCSPHCRFRS